MDKIGNGPPYTENKNSHEEGKKKKKKKNHELAKVRVQQTNKKVEMQSSHSQ